MKTQQINDILISAVTAFIKISLTFGGNGELQQYFDINVVIIQQADIMSSSVFFLDL